MPHVGWYLSPKKGEWMYEIDGWNVVPIAEEIVSNMIQDGIITREQMDDEIQGYWEDAGWSVHSRDVDASQGDLMEEVMVVANQFLDGIDVEFEHIHNDKGRTKANVKKAFQVASDHLYEFPDYYTELEAMERRLKERWKK